MLALVALLALATPDPILGGQKQIILGLKAEPTTVLSYYIWMKSKPNEFGFSTDEYAQRMGFLSAGVHNDVFNNDRVLRFEADGRSKDPQKEFDAGKGVNEQMWVGADGHILRHFIRVQTPKGRDRVLDIVYGTKSIEISVTDDGVEKTTTMYPEGGCQPFFDRFKPMVVDGKVVMKEKKFSLLDPFTLGVIEGKAELAGRFDGMILQTHMKGSTFDITIGGKKQRAYLDSLNNLVKIDITDETYFQIDALPDNVKRGGGS